MVNYEFQPMTEFAIVCTEDGYWWLQEVAEPHKIISMQLPDWIKIVVHKGVDAKGRATPWWAASEIKTGLGIDIGDGFVFDKREAADRAIADFMSRTEEEYAAQVEKAAAHRDACERLRPKELKQ